jgi:hypothetical protein
MMMVVMMTTIHDMETNDAVRLTTSCDWLLHTVTHRVEVTPNQPESST